MRKAERIARDVREWWNDNKSEIMPDTIGECRAIKNSELKDAELLSISEEDADGNVVNIESLQEFIDQYTELIVEGILNVVSTSEA